MSAVFYVVFSENRGMSRLSRISPENPKRIELGILL